MSKVGRKLTLGGGDSTSSTKKDDFFASRKPNLEKFQTGSRYTEKSPTGGPDIEYVLVEIPADKIKSVVKKSKYNKRAVKYLNAGSLSDIEQKMVELKRNREPVKGYGTESDVTLVEGMRRSTIMSSVEDGVLLLWLTPSMSDGDEQAFAAIADQYSKPTTADLALTIRELMEQEQRNYSIRDVMKVFDVPQGTAQNAKLLLQLPDSYFDKFDNMSILPMKLSLKLAEIIKERPLDDADTEMSELTSIETYIANGKSSDEALNALTQDVKRLIAKLKGSNIPVSDDLGIFADVEFVKGVSVKPKKNQYQIVLPKQLAEEKLKQIMELIKA